MTTPEFQKARPALYRSAWNSVLEASRFRLDEGGDVAPALVQVSVSCDLDPGSACQHPLPYLDLRAPPKSWNYGTREWEVGLLIFIGWALVFLLSVAPVPSVTKPL